MVVNFRRTAAHIYACAKVLVSNAISNLLLLVLSENKRHGEGLEKTVTRGDVKRLIRLVSITYFIHVLIKTYLFPVNLESQYFRQGPKLANKQLTKIRMKTMAAEIPIPA